MAKNLTTRYLFKLHANLSLTITTFDALIDELINQVSEAIANHCARTFEATDYKRWFDGTGSNRLVMPEFPITNVYAVSASTKSVATLIFTGGSFATAGLRDGTLFLDSINNSGTESHNTITLASNSMSALATAVSAVTGWTLTVESEDTNEPAVLLRPFEGMWALTPDTADFEMMDETTDVQLAADSDQTLERGSNRSFGALHGHQSRGHGFHNIPQDSGLVFSYGRTNIFVWYKAGYTLPAPLAVNAAPTTEGNVPEDLTLICNQAIKDMYDMGKSSGLLKSEKIGNYSYSNDPNVATDVKNIVGGYKDVLLKHKSARYL